MLEPHERVSVEQALIFIEARLEPASKKTIVGHLARLMNTCGTEQKLSADEVEAKLNDYARHLAEFSEAHLVFAIDQHVRSERWFPKICELIELADGKRSMARIMRHRARVLLGLEEPMSWETAMAERLKSQRERAAADAQVPDLEDRLRALPAGLAEQTRRLVHAAQNMPVEKRGNL